MITLLSIVTLGFFLGMRHATDADHVVAVTTIVSRECSVRRAAWMGVVWGVGHSLTVALVGSAIILFGFVVPPRLGLGLELAVAVMLVGLGLWNLKGFRHWLARWWTQRPAQPRASAMVRHRFSLRPLLVGIVHGLAGSAAVAWLVLPLIRDPAWAAGYLLVFGAGTIVGMTLITAAIVLPFQWTSGRSHAWHLRLGRTAAWASIGLGCFLVYEIGFVQGLLTG